MWPRTELCTLLGIEHPILQAPMAGTATPVLAAAVSNAGGLGGFGLGETPPAEVERIAAAIARGTNRPFNLNVFACARPEPDGDRDGDAVERARPFYARFGLGDPPAITHRTSGGYGPAMRDALLAAGPAVVSFHFGLPPEGDVAAMRAAGIRLIGNASSVAEARAAEAAGMDAVIAQGWEAGGHRGVHGWRPPDDATGTFALVPQVVDAVRLPVIAAGGVSDGRTIAAALALGASGVQIGTAFAACPESSSDDRWRAALHDAEPGGTMVSDQLSGFPARMARRAYAEAMTRGARPADYPAMYGLLDPLRTAARAAGDDGFEMLLMGQAASLAPELPAAALMARLVDETGAALRALGRGLAP